MMNVHNREIVISYDGENFLILWRNCMQKSYEKVVCIQTNPRKIHQENHAEKSCRDLMEENYKKPVFRNYIGTSCVGNYTRISTRKIPMRKSYQENHMINKYGVMAQGNLIGKSCIQVNYIRNFNFCGSFTFQDIGNAW